MNQKPNSTNAQSANTPGENTDNHLLNTFLNRFLIQMSWPRSSARSEYWTLKQTFKEGSAGSKTDKRNPGVAGSNPVEATLLKWTCQKTPQRQANS